MRYLRNGFFYQLGRSLTKIIIGLVLFLIASILLKNFDFNNILLEDVYAISPNAWYDANLDLTPVYIRDIQNNTTLAGGTQISIPNVGSIPGVMFGSLGMRSRFTIQVPYMQRDYAYEVDLYTCSDSGFPQFSMPYSLDYLSQSIDNNRIFSGSQQYENLSGNLSDNFGAFNDCRVNTFYLFGQTGIWLSFPMGVDSNSSPGFTYFGYKFYNLGLSSSVLSSIVGSQSTISSQIQSMESNLHQDANDVYNHVTNVYNGLHQDANDVYDNVNRQSSNIMNNQNSNNNVLVNNNNSNTQEMISNNNSNFNQLNSNITDDSIDTSNANDFFSTNQFDIMNESSDLMSTATMPFEFLEHITETTCTPLHITLPFVNSDFDLPCMSDVYMTYFPNFLSLYRLITDGIIFYYCILKFIDCYRKILDPTLAVVEVYDL